MNKLFISIHKQAIFIISYLIQAITQSSQYD
jgi:hypothetical protein